MPVIAVGRLGDPVTATRAVESGKADFVALGRTLIADPQWVEKLAPRGADPALPCLQHLHRRMRGGAGIGCVVNGAAGRETLFVDAAAAARRAHRGDRRRTRRADLRFAGRRRQCGDRVREGARALAARSATPARRRCSRRSRRTRRSLRALHRRLVAACTAQGRDLPLTHRRRARPGSSRAVRPRSWSRPARTIRFGLGPFAKGLLELGAGHWPGLAQLMSNEALRSGSITGPGAAPRPLPPLARPDQNRHGDRRRAQAPARARKRSRARSRRRCWRRLHRGRHPGTARNAPLSLP